jgi:hypothetical protein
MFPHGLSRYFLPDGYVSREQTEYFDDIGLDEVWQPDVYPDASSLAHRLGSRKVIDVGCGTAGKLAVLHPEFEIVGIDFGRNIARCREAYPFGTWIETDLDHSDDLGYQDFAAAVIVCADVIEHLRYPDRLLAMLRLARSAGALALIISTPDRSVQLDARELGPPANAAHVREWSLAEFSRLLNAFDLPAKVSHTRSSDAGPWLRTTFAVIPGFSRETIDTVTGWFQDRERWLRLATEQAAMIGKLEAQMRELARDNDLMRDQLDGCRREKDA